MPALTIYRAQRAISKPRWRHEYRALWWAEAVSLVGDQLTRVAISVLVFEKTSSSLLTAVTYAMTFVPDALGSLMFSGMADRFPRRELMVISCTIQACLISAVAFPNLPTWLVVVLVACSAVLLAPFRAAQTAVVREVAGESDVSGSAKAQTYADANSRLTIMREAGQLVGLSIAGFAIHMLGLTTALIVDAASFVVAAGLLILGLRPRPAPHTRRGPRAPWQHDRRHAPLVVFILLCSFTVVPFGLVGPLVSELNAPGWTAGLILAADPAGLVVAGQLLKTFIPLEVQQRWMGTFAFISLAALVPLAMVNHWVFAAGLLFLSGAGAAYTITAKTSFQSLVPNHLNGFAAGRVRAGLRICQGTVLMVGGWVALEIGSALRTIAGIGAVGAILCIGTELAWRRQFTHRLPGRWRATQPQARPPLGEQRSDARWNFQFNATMQPAPTADSGCVQHPLGESRP